MPNADRPTLTLTHTTLRRLFRVGCTPVLELTVTHPVLTGNDSDADKIQASATERFNQAYRSVAEAFCTYVADRPVEEATAAFAALGSGAAYTFDRRVVLCRMEAELCDDGFLRVRRTVTLASRRGTLPTRTREAVDRWRLSDLSLCRLSR